MIDPPKATKGRRMSKKTRKKSSKTPSRKAAATSSKTSSAKKRQTIAKKPAPATSKKPAPAASKRSGSAAAKASHQLPSKPLKPAGKAAATRPTVAQPKTAKSKLTSPKPEISKAEISKPAKLQTAKPVASKPLPETTDLPTDGHGALVEGAKAPPFRLPRDGGGTVSLEDFAGQKLLLFFYPRADTPGCTKEAIDFTRLAGAFADSQTVVLGVSADPLKAQESFRDKHQLAVPLVSDEAHDMLQAYGVWGEKSMYGRTFLGISRTTVLIGPDGRILRIWRHVKVDGHADEVLAAVQAT
jgi:thioredoxin-dependent peroxiredoxin